MMVLRKSQERGAADHGWLKTQHTFSFAGYYDPEFMGYRSLRVINEDHVAGGTGFGTHPHRDMEIITYVLSGALEHKDSMGTSSVILPGEVQHMSAGTGVTHSEYNKLKDQSTHLLQIWIEPNKSGHKPRYGQRSFAEDLKNKDLVLVVSPDGREESIPIHQDAFIYASRLQKGKSIEKSLEKGRGQWLQLIKGDLQANGQRLSAGDGLVLEKEPALVIEAQADSEFLLFDLA